MIAVKTKGGMRFVTPSAKKSTLSAIGAVSAKPAVTTHPADTHTTTTAGTTTARANKQSATIAPTSQVTKMMMIMIDDDQLFL